MCCGENVAGHFEGKYQRLSGDYADGVVCRLASLIEVFSSHTLAQKHLIELLMWNASHVQKHFSARKSFYVLQLSQIAKTVQ